MEPRAYCERAINDLRKEKKRQQSVTEGQQMVVVLAYFMQQKPSAPDFASELELLAESAERSHRKALAAAARAVLSDWQSKAAATKS